MNLIGSRSAVRVTLSGKGKDGVFRYTFWDFPGLESMKLEGSKGTESALINQVNRQLAVLLHSWSGIKVSKVTNEKVEYRALLELSK